MDVFLTIQRKNTTIFTDIKETSDVNELKKIIEGITKVPPQNQQLLTADNHVMEDHKPLIDYGISGPQAKPQSPALIKLSFKNETGSFEQPDLVSYSSPPDLPYVMKPHEPSVE